MPDGRNGEPDQSNRLNGNRVSNAGIPREVKDFLSKNITSIEQLEILLLVFRNTAKTWQLGEIAQPLGIQTDAAENCLQTLVERGLVQKHASVKQYQATVSEELYRRVATVAKTYSERRITMINFIFSRHLDRIRAFADSFKLKKDE
jgi:predicted ArsR family transcriptional regulator